MAPPAATITAAPSSPAHPPVPSRQMSNSNTSSRPTTPQNARSKSSRQRKDQPVTDKDAADLTESTRTRSEPRQPRNKPLPTASQLRQMDSGDSTNARPRGIINIPKQDIDSSTRSRSRQGRASADSQHDLVTTSKAAGDRKRSRPAKGSAKGRPAADDITTEDDVFSAGVHPPTSYGKLEPPTNHVKDGKPGRRPRHDRTVSEPFSVVSGTAGDDSFVQHDTKGLPAQGKSRRKRREKDKDKDRGGGGGGRGAEVPLAPALGNLHIQAGTTTDIDSDVSKQPPKRTGLRFPLTEDDDGDSTTSDRPEEVGISDDSGIAFDRNVHDGQSGQSIQGRPFEDLNNAGARLLHELRSLSQSAPGGKSYLTDHTRVDDGYGSGSGYGSAQGQRAERAGKGASRRQPNAGARGDLQDESAVWDMPGLQERGSGTDLTWQQSLLASPAANLRTQTPRRAKEGKPSTPTAAPSASKRNLSTRVTQGFTPSKSQMRDHETFGSTPASGPAQLRNTPSGFATPMKHTQRLQNDRPHPHHTMSAPVNGFAAAEPVKRSVVDDVKVYAGPTFHNSPSADSLPAPRMKGA